MVGTSWNGFPSEPLVEGKFLQISCAPLEKGQIPPILGEIGNPGSPFLGGSSKTKRRRKGAEERKWHVMGCELTIRASVLVFRGFACCG